MTKICEMTGVREYAEGYPVEIQIDDKSGRAVVVGRNEGGYNEVAIDLMDLIGWLKVTDSHIPEERDRPDEIHELRIELLRQWLDAHADHCGCADIPWPQTNKCQWPMPAIITDRIHPNEVYLLLLEARGESFGLRLQAPEG